MTTKAHALMAGSDLHEPKGIAAATAGQVYISNGSGSGVWTDTGATIGSSNFTTGDLKPTFKITADTNWIMCDDGTIGDLSSGATNLASATTQALFYLLWNNCANAEAAVSTGRGASAAADYAAHKTIALPKMLGRVFGISGAGSGLTTRALGKTVGTETHTLLLAESPNHNHTITDPGHFHIPADGQSFLTGPTGGSLFQAGGNASSTGSTNTAPTNITLAAAGGDGAHNNMQPTVFLKMMVKL